MRYNINFCPPPRCPPPCIPLCTKPTITIRGIIKNSPHLYGRWIANICSGSFQLLPNRKKKETMIIVGDIRLDGIQNIFCCNGTQIFIEFINRGLWAIYYLEKTKKDCYLPNDEYRRDRDRGCRWSGDRKMDISDLCDKKYNDCKCKPIILGYIVGTFNSASNYADVPFYNFEAIIPKTSNEEPDEKNKKCC